MFPSHIGSRSTKSSGARNRKTPRFHPTLVLAQRTSRRERGSATYVSIPHWFSLNEVVYIHLLMKNSFHPTLVLAQQEGCGAKHPEQGFPSHIGSRSTRKLLYRIMNLNVSIPHWFSLNGSKTLTQVHVIKFPSHIGSRSTK